MPVAEDERQEGEQHKYCREDAEKPWAVVKKKARQFTGNSGQGRPAFE